MYVLAQQYSDMVLRFLKEFSPVIVAMWSIFVKGVIFLYVAYSKALSVQELYYIKLIS